MAAGWVRGAACAGVWAAVAGAALAEGDFQALARARFEDLRLSGYATVAETRAMARDPAARLEALEAIAGLGLSKMYVEFYRGGVEATGDELRTVRDFLHAHGVAACGGIATVPGGDFGVAADRGLGWFNFQAEKTQRDLARAMGAAAQVFDEIIVDDFLCSGDESAESDAARGGRAWGDYRRDLMTAVSAEHLIGAARAANPDVVAIVKLPQWYDRFHRFGYDPERLPQLYDRVFVGTETRGADTQRFGFTQPYEGFVNYRWLAACAGAKIGGAWFDHGDCDGDDFVDQAWQSVLAGAQELVLFSHAQLAEGHAGHAKLRDDFARLADLARAVRRHPVSGTPAYKPMHSEPGGDLYLLDFLGMLGLPVVPVPAWPADAAVAFVPMQAAHDPAIADRIAARAAAGKTTIVTSAFLAAMDDAALCALAGVAPARSRPAHADMLRDGRHWRGIAPKLGIEDPLLTVTDAEVLLEARVGAQAAPFLTRRRIGRAAVYVLNHHTYSQADFDAVGEVLLSPRKLGLLELPAPWLDALRAAFAPAGALRAAPPRVTQQPLDGAGVVLQNYNAAPAAIALAPPPAGAAWCDGFTGARLADPGAALETALPARARLWAVAR